MKKRTTVVLLIWLLCLGLVITLLCAGMYRLFDPFGNTDSYDTPEEQYELIGRTESEIEELLGPPSGRSANTDNGHLCAEYLISAGWMFGSGKVLLIEYDDGVVVKVRKTSEDF